MSDIRDGPSRDQHEGEGYGGDEYNSDPLDYEEQKPRGYSVHAGYGYQLTQQNCTGCGAALGMHMDKCEYCGKYILRMP